MCSHDGAKLEVYEPRAGHLDFEHLFERGRLKTSSQGSGKLSRRLLSKLGRDEGDIGRPVAVLLSCRADELDQLGVNGDLEGPEGRDDGV